MNIDLKLKAGSDAELVSSIRKISVLPIPIEERAALARSFWETQVAIKEIVVEPDSNEPFMRIAATVMKIPLLLKDSRITVEVRGEEIEIRKYAYEDRDFNLRFGIKLGADKDAPMVWMNKKKEDNQWYRSDYVQFTQFFNEALAAAEVPIRVHYFGGHPPIYPTDKYNIYGIGGKTTIRIFLAALDGLSEGGPVCVSSVISEIRGCFAEPKKINTEEIHRLLTDSNVLCSTSTSGNYLRVSPAGIGKGEPFSYKFKLIKID